MQTTCTANNIRTVKAYGNYYNNPASFAVLNKMENWHFLNNISCRIRPYNNDRPCLRINNIDLIVMYSNRIYSHKIKDYMVYDTFSTHLLYMYLFLEMCHRFFLCHQIIRASYHHHHRRRRRHYRVNKITDKRLGHDVDKHFSLLENALNKFPLIYLCVFICIYMFWYGVFTLKTCYD